MMLRAFISIGLICISLQISFAQINYFHPQSIYDFAEHLFSEKDYNRAAGEYKRYLLLSDLSDVEKYYINLKIARCYRYLDQFDKAIEYLQNITASLSVEGIKDSAVLEKSYIYLLRNEYTQLNELLDGYEFSSVYYKDRSLLLKMVANVKLREWNTAIEVINSYTYGFDETVDQGINDIKELIAEGVLLKRKSKTVSGLLSTIIPGAGKIYAGNIGDGIFTFIATSLTSWLSYHEFNRGNTVRGWVYGGLSGGFYIGSIYGSIVSVKIHNTRISNNFDKRVNAVISIYF